MKRGDRYFMNITGSIEWHDTRLAPDDIPDFGEEVLVTIETFDGGRRTLANVYLKEMDNDRWCWCQKVCDQTRHITEEVMVWYEVVAWAYYPDPYCRGWY